MRKGHLALVLHAHLPYVRSAKPGSLEEDWFFQALIECYLPLIKVLENAYKSKEQNPKLTIGLSPTLLSLLEDSQLKQRFVSWIDVRLNLLKEIPIIHQKATKHLEERINLHLDHWHLIKGDVISSFANLADKQVIDILTCAATHGYLPLLRENSEAVLGQLSTAVREHCRIFGQKPLGIWLPECAYYEGLDILMAKTGLKYAVLDGHGLLHANPRPRYGLYAPICSKNGVAFFGRDSESTLPVWSAKDGYPGRNVYREFHRDYGWDLSDKQRKAIGIDEPRPLGIKLHRVSGKSTSLEDKEIYQPDVAFAKIKKDARNYLQGRRLQLDSLYKVINIEPILVAPFDAELFGHWWFEGPEFLAELFKQSRKESINFVRLKDVLLHSPKLQLCNPSPSSWGKGGFHDYWLNETNAWIVKEWSKASKAFIEHCNNQTSDQKKIRILKQAGRELLLAQSSDWSFILRANTTTKLAKDRVKLHLERFWTLIKLLESTKLESKSLKNLLKFESEDCLFPLIEITDWLI